MCLQQVRLHTFDARQARGLLRGRRLCLRVRCGRSVRRSPHLGQLSRGSLGICSCSCHMPLGFRHLCPRIVMSVGTNRPMSAGSMRADADGCSCPMLCRQLCTATSFGNWQVCAQHRRMPGSVGAAVSPQQLRPAPPDRPWHQARRSGRPSAPPSRPRARPPARPPRHAPPAGRSRNQFNRVHCEQEAACSAQPLGSLRATFADHRASVIVRAVV